MTPRQCSEFISNAAHYKLHLWIEMPANQELCEKLVTDMFDKVTEEVAKVDPSV